MNRLLYAIMMILIVLPLAGCASSTPVPTFTPLPTSTSTPLPTATPEPTPSVSAETIEEIDQFLTKMNKDQHKFNGIALVAKDGKVLLHKAYGMADQKNNIPLQVDTLMPTLVFELEATSILLLEELWPAEQEKLMFCRGC